MTNLVRRRIGWDQLVIASAYLYLVVPIMIFMIGWLKLPIAVLSAALLLVAAYRTLDGFDFGERSSSVDLKYVIYTLLIVAGWIVLSGIGGFGLQNDDFHYRNAVFRDLINRPWPVVYDYTADPKLGAIFGDSGALVYYFGYWLPSAIVGKLLGWNIANLALFAWTLAGAFLCVELMRRYVGRASVLIVLTFVLWSGMDFAGMLVVNWHEIARHAYTHGTWSFGELGGRILALMLDGSRIEDWPDAYGFYYNSMTVQLFWVFNSAIPSWMVTLLFLNLKKAQSALFTTALLLYFSPLAALGLAPYLIFQFARHIRAPAIGSAWVRFAAWRDVSLRAYLSFQNTVVVGVLAIIGGLFYAAQAADQPHGFIWNMRGADWGMILTLLAFFLLAFGAFGILVFDGKNNRGLLIFTLVLLGVIPLYSYGLNNDFALKASVPPLMILLAVGVKNAIDKFSGPLGSRERLARLLLVAVLLIGSITPLHEFLRSRDAIVAAHGFPGYAEGYGTFGNSKSRNIPGLDDKMKRIGNFVLGHPEDTLFFKYLARSAVAAPPLR